MFERYVEKTRRVIFFARYEAGNFGSSSIETQHVLLGLAREDLPLLQSYLGDVFSADLIRKEIEERTGVSAKNSPSTNLPLSLESKRVLAWTAQEADRLCSTPILPEHLLFGLLQEKQSLAAQILNGHGLTLDALSRISELSPEEQQRWKASRRRAQRIHRWTNMLGILLNILFGLFFVQLACKTAVAPLTHIDAVFYAIAFPILAAVMGAIALWRYRLGFLTHKKALRFAIIVAFLFFASMGMAFAGLRH